MAEGLIRNEEEPDFLRDALQRIKALRGDAYESSVNPGTFVPDDVIAQQARQTVEDYQALDSQREATFKSDIVPPPDVDTPFVVDAANFLFHDEAALLGVSVDREGVNFKLDTARDMVSDHPIRSGLAALTLAGPVLAGVKRLGKVSRVGEAAIDAKALHSVGLIDNIAEFEALSPDLQKLVTNQADRIADIRNIRAAINDGTATPWQRAKGAFYESFGNTYLDKMAHDKLNPRSAIEQWQETVKGIVSGRATSDLLDASRTVNPEQGIKIIESLRDPAVALTLPEPARSFAIAYREEAKAQQILQHQEGFIDDDTFAKIGDVWFSTLRKGSPIFDQGPTTGVVSVLRKGADKTEIINIPRTSSPNLMERQTDNVSLDALIKRQKVSEIISNPKMKPKDKDKAISLLRAMPEEQDALIALQSGDLAGAAKILGREGLIESDPQKLVINSLMQQKLSFENFRYLRDIATNPDITKTAGEVQKMPRAVRSRMRNLDTIQNAGTLRRMIAKKLGKDSYGPLGWVHEGIFKEFATADSGFKSGITLGLDALEIFTAIHKTAVTALNIPTHMQNVVGNYVFSALRGFNMANPENHNIVWGTSLTAVNRWRKAIKEGRSLENVGDLGSIQTKSGKTLNIAEEILKPEVREILEESTIMEAEGLPVLERMASKLGKEQTTLKGILGFVQKAAGIKIPGTKLAPVEALAHAYTAEDTIFKMGYYLKLRQQGLNSLSAANEVARSFPMYNTIGSVQKGARKAILPWISFSTEAARIMKNNMMDNPGRTYAMLHLPQLTQFGAARLSGMDYQSVEDQRAMNPNWAQKGALSLVTGIKDINNEIRTVNLDFLPWSAIMPPTLAEDAPVREKLPFGMNDPAPIITGFIDAIQGRGNFGQDIATDPNDKTAAFTNALLGFVRFLAPPVIGKYGISLESPDLTYKIGQDTGFNVNPTTGKPGDPVWDAVINNTMPFKAYPGSVDQKMTNEYFSDKRMTNFRARLGKEFAAWVKSGNWQEANETLRSAYHSFLSETNDPAKAWQQYMDWLKSRSKLLEKNPAFRGMSKKEIIDRLTEVGNETAPVLTQQRQQYIQALQDNYKSTPERFDGTNPLTRGARSGRSGRSGREARQGR